MDFWLVLGGDTAYVDLCSPQRTSKTKMHQVSWHIFRSTLNCSMINIAILALLYFTAEVCSGDIPCLQCCMIQILTKGTWFLADALSALLQLPFFYLRGFLLTVFIF